MKLSDFYNWLSTFLNFEKTQTKGIFWLDSMKFLAEKLGNPQNEIPCIHVAGSKGKGSVSAMLSNIIEASGKKCGLYTSPHISDFRERVKSASSFFEDSVYEKAADTLVECVNSIKESELPGQRPLTWFELVTVYSFLCFKYANVDYAVYETGLGGRLDSTNIVKPLLSVLMPIEKEHTEFLGNTISEIAGEKAGIIKAGRPCIVSFQNYIEAEEVFLKKSESMKSECLFVKDFVSNTNYSYTSQGLMNLSFDFTFAQKEKEKYQMTLKMLGKVQAQNAQTALLAIKKALPGIKKNQIIQGLENTFIPARFEIKKIGKSPIVLDGAHTVKSISNTIECLKSVYPEKNYKLLFACAGDKDIEDIIPLFKNTFEKVIFTSPKSVRSCNSKKSFQLASKENIKCELIDDLKCAINTLISQAQKTDIIIVTGSFYLVSEVKELLSELEKQNTNWN